jgi:hypothetical protein
MAAGLCVCTVCRGEDLQCGAPAHLRLDATDPEAGGAHRQGTHEEDDRDGNSSTHCLSCWDGGGETRSNVVVSKQVPTAKGPVVTIDMYNVPQSRPLPH